MKIFVPEPKISDTSGFEADDTFCRKDLGLGIIHLLTNVTDPMVIALDAPWGSGKTIFLRMLSGELRQLGVPVIYFDAFANDHMEDPFLALAGEVIALAKTKQPATVKKFSEKAVSVGKVLLKSSSKLAVRALVRGATLGALTTNDIGETKDEISDDLADEASALLERQLERILETVTERNEVVAAFKCALTTLSKLLADTIMQSDDPPAHRPLVFVIDELDRCTPPFALKLLERIKHFFAVANVHFILGIHKDQLCNSVKASYGSGIDAETYLQKFINVNIELTDTARYDHDRVPNKYISYIRSRMPPYLRSRYRL